MFVRRFAPLMFLILLAALAVPVTYPQLPPQGGAPDLSEFSTAQLSACYGNLKLCGAKDIWEISNELNSRLPSAPSERLVACFDDWKLCGAQEDRAAGWPISDELGGRGNVHWLLDRYWDTHNMMIRNGIEHVAYHFDTPETTAFMRRVVAERVYDGEDRYWPVNYLAKKCDAIALRELSTGRYRNQGSLQYESSVKLFGKCTYKAAIPYLVDTALYDFSLNIVGAAEESLKSLYPDAPSEFATLPQEQQYFCRRARADGFKVTCKLH